MKKRHVWLAARIGFLALALGAVGTCSVASAAAGGPTVVLTSTSTAGTAGSAIPIVATFSEPVSGASLSGISTTNGTAGNFSGSGAVYTFDVTPVSQATSTVMILADSASSTASSTGNQASNILTFPPGSGSNAPVIAETSGIASTTSSASPSYSFSSSAAGAIGLTGGCMSSTTSAVSGSNTITFQPLADGPYSCSLSVMDSGGHTSNTLPIDFTVMTSGTSTSGQQQASSTAPVISDIQVMTSGTSDATITWTTDTAATGQVFYGSTASYGSMSTLNTATSTNHVAYLGGLAEGGTYHFQIVSSNAAGSATSSDQVFTGGTTASTTPLALSGVDAVRSTATADGSFADGWSWVLHFTVPSVEDSFQLRFNDFTGSASGSIPVADNVRYYSAQSSNASSSGAAIVETGNSYGTALMLTGDTAPATPGRQVDVTVEMAVPFGTAPGSYSTIFGALSTTTAASAATTTP